MKLPINCRNQYLNILRLTGFISDGYMRYFLVDEMIKAATRFEYTPYVTDIMRKRYCHFLPPSTLSHNSIIILDKGEK